jgi:hypothetical protein
MFKTDIVLILSGRHHENVVFYVGHSRSDFTIFSSTLLQEQSVVVLCWRGLKSLE